MSAEPWLRGPVEGVIAELQPVAHALLYAREQLERVLPALSNEQLWQRPGDIASIGFHVRHSMGTIERMLTYARGDALSTAQLDALKAEKDDRPDLDAAALLQLGQQTIDRALTVMRSARANELDEPRAVGRLRLPSNLRGLYFEIAVHTARHIGQIATTAKLI
jgi:hypothetical protein